jgi:hypothetical protein
MQQESWLQNLAFCRQHTLFCEKICGAKLYEIILPLAGLPLKPFDKFFNDLTILTPSSNGLAPRFVWFITEELGLSDDSCDIHLEGFQFESLSARRFPSKDFQNRDLLTSVIQHHISYICNHIVK